ncbi:hypothetical protein ACFVZ3_06460 [Kitasatospora purpeofusca]|uniref:hypothetical protein n=1 Tax=Kitasatospora purpeofusca TaxID=67352 RepID=UPI00367C17E7
MSTSGSAPELTADLLEARQSGDVIDAAGRWLVAQPALDGFTWIKSRRALEAKSGSRRETITVESSYRDRARQSITFTAAAIAVTDTTLRAWRRENPDRTLVRSASVDGIVCAASLLDFGSGSSVNLADPSRRLSRLDMVLEHLREHALPWFTSTADPRKLPASVPEVLLRPWGFTADLVEYLAVHDHLDDARALIMRALAQGPDHQSAFDEGRHLVEVHARPRWHSSPSLGWTATTLGLS